MARAVQSPERDVRPAQMIRQGSKGPHRAEGEPVTVGIDTTLVVPRELVREVRDRVALPTTRLVADVLVPAREGDRLEGDAPHLVVVLDHEVEDWAHAPVVDRIDHC